MSELRISAEAEAELDEIWLYIARASGSVETANRIIDDITDSLWVLARHPYIGAETRSRSAARTPDPYVRSIRYCSPHRRT